MTIDSCEEIKLLTTTVCDLFIYSFIIEVVAYSSLMTDYIILKGVTTELPTPPRDMGGKKYLKYLQNISIAISRIYGVLSRGRGRCIAAVISARGAPTIIGY